MARKALKFSFSKLERFSSNNLFGVYRIAKRHANIATRVQRYIAVLYMGAKLRHKEKTNFEALQAPTQNLNSKFIPRICIFMG